MVENRSGYEVQGTPKAPEGERRSVVKQALGKTAETLFPFAVGLGERNDSSITNKKARIVLGALGDISGYTLGLMTVATKDAMTGEPFFPLYVRIGLPLLIALPHLKSVGRLLRPNKEETYPKNPK